MTQLGYTGKGLPLIGGSSWGIAAAYSYSRNIILYGTSLAVQTSLWDNSGNSYNSIGISGYWVPESNGWIPSISSGWGLSGFNNTIYLHDSQPRVSSWYVGLQWKDVISKGNDFGMAVGQMPYTSSLGRNNQQNYSVSTAIDSNYAWEWWYKIQVTDNISVTPAVYWVSNFDGMTGRNDSGLPLSGGDYSKSNNVFGGLLKTTFKF